MGTPSGVVFGRRLCVTSSCSAWVRRPPAITSKRPVFAPSSSRIGRTVRAVSKVRRAMSSASSSMDSCAFTRRTLASDRTSLSKGISREALSVLRLPLVWVGMRETSATSRPRRSRPLSSSPASRPALARSERRTASVLSSREGEQAYAASISVFARTSMASWASCCGFVRATAVIPWTKSNTLSGAALPPTAPSLRSSRSPPFQNRGGAGSRCGHPRCAPRSFRWTLARPR